MSQVEPHAGVVPEIAGTPEDIARFVVDAAVNAPSVHNSQPWWFYGIDREIGLHADDERQLRVADPDGREMMISCGAALFTARVALRFCGIVPNVRVFPEPDLGTLVAKINWADEKPPSDYERDLFDAIYRRRTHRGGFDSEEMPGGIFSSLRDEAGRENAELRFIGDQLARDAVAAIVEAGDFTVRHNSAMAREQTRWAGAPYSKRRDGVPVTAYPGRLTRTEPYFPQRDFARGHGWGVAPAGQGQLPRSAGVVALLTTSSDRPEDWVSAGQALQRTLLCATVGGLSAAMHSQPLEVPQLRDFLRMQFCDGSYPQMVLRFGVTAQPSASVRRAVSDVLL
ncbi:MAG TPA: hypothetical protein VFQ44_15070 [Streptosporangiaceae bacterium]|nr:hypothetical protein [Streptosporangiaceae bacterium]